MNPLVRSGKKSMLVDRSNKDPNTQKEWIHNQLSMTDFEKAKQSNDNKTISIQEQAERLVDFTHISLDPNYQKRLKQNKAVEQASMQAEPDNNEYILSPTGQLWLGHESQEDYDHNMRLCNSKKGYVRNHGVEQLSQRMSKMFRR